MKSDREKYDFLELKEVKQDSVTLKVRKDTVRVKEGVLSYIDSEDKYGHKTYIPFWRIERWSHGSL